MGETQGPSAMSCVSRSEADGLLASSLDSYSFMTGSMENVSASLRENESALTVLENLERYWFWDNIFNSAIGPPPSGSYLSSSMDISMSVRSCPNLEASSSVFRSIEMVTSKATDMRDSREADVHVVEFPKPYLQRTCSALEEREKGSVVQDKLRQRQRQSHRRSLSAMALELEISHSPLEDSIHLCSSSEHVVHDPYDGGEESKHAKTAPSSTMIPQPPSTVPRLPKLKAIPSDEQLQERKPEVGIQQTTVRRRERRRATRSMTDLEFDEVQGFMDLGFKFNMDKLSPHVVSVLPGLQRLGRQGKTQRHAQPPSRPYLSEAWLIRRPDSPLLNWRMPSLDEKGVDMKKQLKFWARAVASTVQQQS